MQAIFASKMFKSSKRQDAIRAAISDPINAELVQQLSEYLDDEYKESKVDILDQQTQEDTTTEETSEETSEETTESEDNGDTEVNVSVESSPSNAPHAADHHLSDMLKEEEGAEPIQDGSEPPEPPKESSDVSESTSVIGESITASESPQKCPTISIADQTDSIMGLLNSSQDSTGVRYALVKGENELWIYYKDSVNLNNVMEPAIALLNSADYGLLSFNRLARTDNAIVFDITFSQKPVDPVEPVEKDE